MPRTKNSHSPQLDRQQAARYRPSRTGVTTFLLMLFLPSGCNPLPRSQRPAQGLLNRTVAVVGPVADDPVWPIIRIRAADIEQSERELRFEYYELSQNTGPALRDTLDGINESKATAVFIFSPAVVSGGNEIDRLSNNGKRVVLVGTDHPKSLRAVYCGPSQSETGRAAARACAEMTPSDRRTSMLLHGSIDDITAAARLTGFKDETERLGKIEIFKQLDCNGDPIEAQRIVRRQSRLYPRVGAFVMLDDWALRTSTLDERLTAATAIVIVCGDSIQLRSLLRNRHIDALIGYNVAQAVDDGLRAAGRLATNSGDEALTRITREPIVVKIDDLENYEAQWEDWSTANSTAR